MNEKSEWQFLIDYVKDDTTDFGLDSCRNQLLAMNARIRWGYLEYCEQPNPFFVIELEDTGDGCWICTRDENGDQLTSDIVEDKDIPDLNTPIDEAIKVMFHNIVNTAHNCY